MTTSIFAREPRPCIMVRLSCPSCGLVRLALPPQQDAITSHECPYCFTSVPAEAIGNGHTFRDLPFFSYEGEPLGQCRPPQVATFSRLERGQLVVYCEEKDILHLAHINELYTSARHLGPKGVPSVTFVRNGEETEPVPHASASDNLPPFWCLIAEAKATLKTSNDDKTRTPPAKPERKPTKPKTPASKRA